jgi:flagellar protein FlaG
MAGSIELSTQGVSSAFRVEQQTAPSLPPPPKVEAKDPPSAKSEQEGSQGSNGGLQKQAVTDVADALNSVSKAIDRDLQFSVDEETGRIVIKVTNSATGEVIRVIPPEDISRTRDGFGSLVGLLFSEES